ncbi:hypothetical protein FOG18_10225 [Legionella israelensis]|uniref:flagellar basal body rod protein FlgB n=1 Tax=Legionella israelensis TaxID=454 RepID=UPI00117ED2A6|nr:hypothetical protein [Legionella israelensis]QDP72910.1 hypothetical protein FOG18_10225 [Legionella israelensis]
MNTDNTVQLIKLALDACDMRQIALASNMANIHTQNYQAISVNFEEQLDKGSALKKLDISTIKPFYQTEDIKLSPDSLLTEGLKNMTHYRALMRGLNQKLSILKIALHGNSSS